MLQIARTHGITGIDTARLYGLGISETFLGQQNAASEFEITTKAPSGFLPDSATKSAIIQNGTLSLEALKTSKVPIYLLHGPDDSVPLSETLDGVQELYLRGAFEKFGLSNFSLPQIREVYEYNKSKGYVLPTVYQSIYNLVARNNETELFPALRDLGFSIQVYSPIASGFLVKKPADIEQQKGKWDPSTGLGKLLQGLYGKPELLNFLREYIQLAEESGNSQAGLAYRWVRYNSALKGELGDSVLLGANGPEQLRGTLADLGQGPLEDWVVQRLDALWEGIREVAPVDNLTTFKALS
ncbi:Aldo/keto reductase [Aspergillus steynii IBT 23096]|uniref:Aldo/keto reductase n=1 Tax=Aspergillus steynii IBT 23096 TaxID=1392250 RepID=A0A2I2GI60_9EURO|nr:Aldo/keto reductase [Aspergillus steynii IBT 23096]PLB52554.1 Aldo/keto reductase [Aspergillus steynii IBT 23096]